MSVPFVTDHALLRYLERACGINVELIRDHVALICAPTANAGAKNYHRGDVVYVYRDGSVVTVLSREMRPKERHSEASA